MKNKILFVLCALLMLVTFIVILATINIGFRKGLDASTIIFLVVYEILMTYMVLQSISPNKLSDDDIYELANPRYILDILLHRKECRPTRATDGSNGWDCYIDLINFNKEKLGDLYDYCRDFIVQDIRGEDGVVFKRLVIRPNGKVIVPLGFSIALYDDLYSFVLPKSGIGLKTNVIIPNSPGLVDTDYRGEIKVILVNNGNRDVIIDDLKPVCQMIVLKAPRLKFNEVDTLDETERGDKGHGHSHDALGTANN